jgi:hypothetical protein
MKYRPGYLLALAALLLLLFDAQHAHAQLPLLERYTLESLSLRRGTVYELQDGSLGGGDAQARLHFKREKDAGTLRLRVWRRVPAGTTSFALLGERIEVRGYDFEGTTVFSRDFVGLDRDGIHFGDSRSGTWQRTLRKVPAAVTRIEVAFLGNYE